MGGNGITRKKSTNTAFTNAAFEMQNLFFTVYAKIVAALLCSEDILTAHSKLPLRYATITVRHMYLTTTILPHQELQSRPFPKFA